MEIGIVGLGRMGAGMAQRLAHVGMKILCYDRADEARNALKGAANIECVQNLAALCARLEGERIVVLMLPAGEAVEDTINELIPMLFARDAVVHRGHKY